MSAYWRLLLCFCFYVVVECYEVKLTKRSTLYIPFGYYMNGTGMYALNQYPVEQMTHDHVNQRVYTAGISLLHAIDVSDPDNMRILSFLQYPGMEFTDVEYCGGYIFTTMDDKTDRANGKVSVFTATVSSIIELMQIPVGAIPDMVKPTSDCSKLVVAVEGEGYEEPPGQITDPPGLIVIISFPNGVNNGYSIVSLNFTQYDDKVEDLSLSGVRHVYQEDNNPFSNDVEPEYVTINEDDTIAYVSLQENNAIAVVDLTQQKITAIHGLGFKDWSKLRLDPSDQDNGAMLYPYNVRGMYLPDGIAHFTFDAQHYIILANEGGSKNYFFENNTWTEEERAGRLNTSLLPNLDPLTADQVTRDSLLGRLKVSVSPTGMDTSGRLKALYTFGGRSFSIRRADDMSIVYDSGDNITKAILAYKNNLFNCMAADINNRPFEEYDTRSDNKGPETETVDVGVVDGVTLLFVVNERPGTIFVYSIHSNLSDPVLQDIYDGIPYQREKSWSEMFEERILSEIDPEDVHFVPASKSPTGNPILFSTGSISGTVSIINVEISQTGSKASLMDSGLETCVLAVILLFISIRRHSLSSSIIS